MAEEKPTIEEPTKEPVADKPETPAEIDVDAVMSKLAELNRTTPESIDNMARASQEAGNSARLLGEQRKANEQLMAKLDSLEAQRVQPANDLDLDSYQPGQTVNLEEMIGNAVEKRVENILVREKQQTAQQQRAALEQQQSIMNDRNYKNKDIREVFERKLADPYVQMQIQSGQINLNKLWYSTVDGYKDTLLGELGKTIEQINTPVAPHVEQAGRTSANLVQGKEEDNPRAERLSELRKKVETGEMLSEEEELEMIGLI